VGRRADERQTGCTALDAAVNGVEAADTAVGRKRPKSNSTVFVKTLEAERKLMEKHIESQQIESRPFA
jgi:hypothetical protein